SDRIDASTDAVSEYDGEAGGGSWCRTGAQLGVDEGDGGELDGDPDLSVAGKGVIPLNRSEYFGAAWVVGDDCSHRCSVRSRGQVCPRYVRVAWVRRWCSAVQ